METTVRGQVEALSVKDNSIEVCVTRISNIAKDLFAAEFTDCDDSDMEESLLQKILSDWKSEPRDLLL